MRTAFAFKASPNLAFFCILYFYKILSQLKLLANFKLIYWQTWIVLIAK